MTSYRDKGQMFGTDGAITWTEPELFDMLRDMDEQSNDEALDKLATEASKAHTNTPELPKYDPARKRVGDPSPQTEPELFTRDEIMSEVRYLMRLNKRHGSNPLRTVAYLKLLRYLDGER